MHRGLGRLALTAGLAVPAVSKRSGTGVGSGRRDMETRGDWARNSTRTERVCFGTTRDVLNNGITAGGSHRCCFLPLGQQ